MVSIESLEIDFQQYWLILKRRWLPAISIFSFVLILAVLAAFRQKPVYQAQGKLLLKVDRTASLTGVETDLGEFSPLTLQNSPLKTESEVLQSAPFLEKVIAQFKLRDQNGDLLKPAVLMDSALLKVEPISGADILQVSFKDSNPQTAADVVNLLMQEYINRNILTSRKQAIAAREVIFQQLPRTQARLQQADAALRKFKEVNDITNLAKESEELVAGASELQNPFTKAKLELADANSRLVDLQNKVGLSSKIAVDLSSLSQSPGVQQALKEIQDVQKDLAVARSSYSEQFPTVVSLKEKEASLRSNLRERVSETLRRSNGVPSGSLQIGETKQDLIQKLVDTEVERSGLASRVDRLSKTREIYQRRANILPKLEQEQRELERRLDVAQSNYEILQKKLQEVQVAEKQNIGNASVIEAASAPDKPVVKGIMLILVMGGLLATSAAIATVIMLEVGDRSVKSLKEVRQLLKYPLLGSIPLFNEPTLPRGKNANCLTPALPARDFPQAPVSAAYRLLQASLRFLYGRKEQKNVVVTSSVPKEGKSTISANLAATIAQLGRSVLLIDTDLHNPQQHHIWNLTNTFGLSNVIVKQTNFATVVNKVMGNLDVLTSGEIPPNPLAIVDSEAMQALITSTAQQYDFVILDTPPLLVEAEALTLGKMTDGMLLVVRPGVLDFASANTANELLMQSDIPFLGLVVNCVASESESNRFTHYKQDKSNLLNSLPQQGLSKQTTSVQ